MRSGCPVICVGTKSRVWRMARLSRRGRGVTRGEYVAGFHNLPNKFAGYTLAGCTGQVPQRSADDPPAGVDAQPGGWPTVRSPSGRKRSAGRLWPQDSATPHRGSTSRKSAAIGEIAVALKHDLSNALIEFANTKIRLLTRGVFGFKSPSAENFFSGGSRVLLSAGMRNQYGRIDIVHQRCPHLR